MASKSRWQIGRCLATDWRMNDLEFRTFAQGSGNVFQKQRVVLTSVWTTFMLTENQIILPDGRKLAYAEFGRPDGYPVLYFHGSPSSRLEPLLIGNDTLAQFGLRFIAPDRPGMGLSDFQPKRGFSDWPKDVVFLADSLGLDEFSVLGLSGGGGYAAVCAARIPERLNAAVIVSGGWRMDWPEAKDNLVFPYSLVQFLARKAPFLLRLLLKGMTASSPGDPEKELAQLQKRLPPADYAAFAQQPGRVDALHRTVRESMRQGTKGPAWDMGLYTREFDFRSDEIRMPVKMFHGEQDLNVPIALARRAAAELPNVQLVTYDNEAHLSTFCNHMDEIAQALKPSPNPLPEGVH